MGKRETKDTYKDTQKLGAAATNEYSGAIADSAARAASYTPTIDTGRAELEGLYRGLGTNVKSVDTGNLSDSLNRYNAFADTGGYDAPTKGRITNDIGSLRELGKTGGLDAESIGRFRGAGVFDEFATTGGYSEGDKANIRSRALSPISSYASTTRDELARRRNVQGGYAPGFDAGSRSLRRDTSRAISDTSRDAELDIKDRVLANRFAGAGAISQAEGNLQQLRTGNMFRGTEGAINQERGLQDAINNYKLAGMSGAQAAAAAIADIDRSNIANEQQQKLLGIGGLESLYGSDINQQESEYNRGGQLLGDKYGIASNINAQRTNLAEQPGVGGNILRGVGAAAGVGGALFGGGISGGTPRFTPTNGEYW